MRAIAIVMSIIALAGLVYAAQTTTGGREFYKVYGSVVAQQAAGTGVIVRTDAELATITNNYKSQTISLVIDDGRWYVSNNIVFPTNITVAFAAGSSLDTSNSAAVTFLGGFSAPQNQQIFYGNSTFVSPSMVISNPAWWGAAGDPVAIRVADNSITSAKIVDGTITGSDVASGTLTGTNIADNSITSNKLNSAVWSTVASIAAQSITASTTNGNNNTWNGANMFNGQVIIASNQIPAALFGCPKLTLTTNMFESTAAASAGGASATAIAAASFGSLIDGNFSNTNAVMYGSGGSGAYGVSGLLCDLGANYYGYVLIINSNQWFTTASISAGKVVDYSTRKPLFNASANGYDSAVGWNVLDTGRAGGDHNTNGFDVVCMPFAGRYISESYQVGNTSAFTNSVCEFVVYGYVWSNSLTTATGGQW